MSDEVWEDHERYVRILRNEAYTWLLQAIGALEPALFSVRKLASDQVYDTEYAEGEGDIQRLLEQAHSALAGAQALMKELHT